MLRAAHWNFARKTERLSLLKAAPGTPENTSTVVVWSAATMPAQPWLYEYAYPSDALLIRSVFASPSVDTPPDAPALPAWRGTLEAGYARYRKFDTALGADTGGQPINVVLTDAQQAVATYTARVTSEALWDTLFQEAMVLALASRFAFPLTGNMALQRSIAQQARSTLDQARASNGNEGLTTTDFVPDWLAIRGVASNSQERGYGASWSDPGFLGV